MNKNSIPQSSKRAAIYIRTSTERQGEKVSPQAQEKDCQALCERMGYRVVGIYADTEKYRVGRKMVEPSGTRADRPALMQILADTYAGKIDVIIAWREDRLYRSYRPMLDVLDCLDKTGIDIELVKETFDKRIAPVKAWAAKMELEAKHDRMMMGTAGRLASGKPWNQDPPFGYSRDEQGYWVIKESEAVWLRKIFAWYADGDSVRVIRQRLIDGSAEQRETRKHEWSARVLYKYIQNDYLWTGVYLYQWDGKSYEIHPPIIIDQDVAQKVMSRRSKFGKYPDGNAKHNCLCAGLIYCAHCGVRMSAINKTSGKTNKDGTLYRYEFYRCGTLGYPIRYEGCAKEVRSANIDDVVWEKVSRYLAEPEEFERALEARVKAIEAQEIDVKAECAKLVDRLAELGLERQKIVTAFRKSYITEEDLSVQIALVTDQEKQAREELSEKQLLIGNRAERLAQLSATFREQMTGSIEALTKAAPSTEEERKEQLVFRRKIIQAVVERVNVYADKSVTIDTVIELSEPQKVVAPVGRYVIEDIHPFSFRLTL